MENLGVKTVHEGSVWLIEILVSIALITASAGVVAQYCSRIGSAQQYVADRLGMLTAIHTSIETCMRTNDCSTMRIKPVAPHIQSDIPEIAALGVHSFYQIEIKTEGTQSGPFFYAGVIAQEGVLR